MRKVELDAADCRGGQVRLTSLFFFEKQQLLLGGKTKDF